MKRAHFIGVLMLLALSVSVFAQTEYVPSWKVGDKWVLETSYKDLNSRGEVYLPPVQWVFKVRAIKQKDGIECYVLHIFTRRGEMKEQAVLWLATDDLRPVRIVDIYPTSSGMRHSERDIDLSSRQPIIANDTLVPYDMPVFPLVKEAEAMAIEANSTRAQSASGMFAPVKQKFASVKKAGGFSFKRQLTQSGSQPDKQYAEQLKKFDSKSNLNGSRAQSAQAPVDAFQVKLSESRSNTELTQVWREGLPWAAASQTNTRKARLVPESELLQGGNK